MSGPQDPQDAPHPAFAPPPAAAPDPPPLASPSLAQPPPPPPPEPPPDSPLGLPHALLERLAASAPVSDIFLASLVAVHLLVWFEVFRQSGRAFTASELWLSVPSDVLIERGAVLPSLVREGQVWRVLTAPFLHSNLLHLVISALFVRSLCGLAERLLGRSALALGLLGGAIGSSIWIIQEGGILAGAIGTATGVSGLLVAGLNGPGVPPALASDVRRRLLVSLIFFVVLGWVLNAAFAAADVPIALGNEVLLGGFAGGLVAGLLVAPPLVPWAALAPGRRAVHAAACALSLAAALLMGLTGGGRLQRALVWASGGDWEAYQLERGRPLEGRDAVAADPKASLVPGLLDDLRRVEEAALGLSLEVPAGWSRLDGGKDHAVYGPRKGAPFLQLHVIRRPEGAFMPDYGDPDTVLAEVRSALEKGGAEDVMAAPFTRTRLGGLPAARMDIRYRQHGQELQRIMLLARGRSAVYSISFLGLDQSADAIAARLSSGLRFTEAAQ